MIDGDLSGADASRVGLERRPDLIFFDGTRLRGVDLVVSARQELARQIMHVHRVFRFVEQADHLDRNLGLFFAGADQQRLTADLAIVVRRQGREAADQDRVHGLGSAAVARATPFAGFAGFAGFPRAAAGGAAAAAGLATCAATLAGSPSFGAARAARAWVTAGDGPAITRRTALAGAAAVRRAARGFSAG